MRTEAEDVLDFWFRECGPDDWFGGGEALDARIRSRFEDAWRQARAGRLARWRASARGSLALVVLTDQFPRNMFRGQGLAFATDPLAREAAGQAVARGFDMTLAMPERGFLYLPFEHSESVTDQSRAVRLIASRTGSDELALHARAHRAVIRRFGRFPFRNEALGRRSSVAEAAWLAAGAYGAEVRALREAG